MITLNDVYRIGTLGKPHGVKGEIAFPFDDDVFDREDADYLFIQIGRSCLYLLHRGISVQLRRARR